MKGIAIGIGSILAFIVFYIAVLPVLIPESRYPLCREARTSDQCWLPESWKGQLVVTEGTRSSEAPEPRRYTEGEALDIYLAPRGGDPL